MMPEPATHQAPGIIIRDACAAATCVLRLGMTCSFLPGL
jgi:hypothetical protein